MKCNDRDCCGEMQSAWMDVFTEGFLPVPVKMGCTQAGPQVSVPNDEKASDTFCNLA